MSCALMRRLATLQDYCISPSQFPRFSFCFYVTDLIYLSETDTLKKKYWLFVKSKLNNKIFAFYVQLSFTDPFVLFNKVLSKLPA